MDKSLRIKLKSISGIKFNSNEQLLFEQSSDANLSLIESITRVYTKDVKPYCQPMTDFDLLREDNAKTDD